MVFRIFGILKRLSWILDIFQNFDVTFFFFLFGFFEFFWGFCGPYEFLWNFGFWISWWIFEFSGLFLNLTDFCVYFGFYRISAIFSTSFPFGFLRYHLNHHALRSNFLKIILFQVLVQVLIYGSRSNTGWENPDLAWMTSVKSMTEPRHEISSGCVIFANERNKWWMWKQNDHPQGVRHQHARIGVRCRNLVIVTHNHRNVLKVFFWKFFSRSGT